MHKPCSGIPYLRPYYGHPHAQISAILNLAQSLAFAVKIIGIAQITFRIIPAPAGENAVGAKMNYAKTVNPGHPLKHMREKSVNISRVILMLIRGLDQYARAIDNNIRGR